MKPVVLIVLALTLGGCVGSLSDMKGDFDIHATGTFMDGQFCSLPDYLGGPDRVTVEQRIRLNIPVAEESGVAKLIEESFRLRSLVGNPNVSPGELCEHNRALELLLYQHWKDAKTLPID